MSNPAERIDLPSGLTVWFVEATHAYFGHNEQTGKKSKRLTGVTTVTKTLDYDPSKLLTWAAKTQCLGVAELVTSMLDECKRDELRWLTSQDSIWSRLIAEELDFEHVRDRAAQRGTNVHQIALQALAMGRPVPDLDALTEEEQGYARAVMAFWLEHEPQTEQVEQIVYSERLGVAGRLDFRGRLTTRDGIGVLDAKTSRFLSASAHAQVGGYRLLAEESGFGPSEWGVLLKLNEDGTYELVESQAAPADFELAVGTYRAAGRINREAGKARKAAQTRRTLDEEIEKAVAA